MPMTAAPPAAGEDIVGAPSRSAMIQRTVAGHHLLHIDAYSQTKEELPTGKYLHIDCLPGVGGSSWRIHYYPNGSDYYCDDYVSVFVGIDRSAAAGIEPFMALARFSLLDQVGKPVQSHVRTTRIHDFIGHSFGYSQYIKRKWLEKSEHLKDDRFTIRCDIIVTTILSAVDTTDASPPLVKLPPPDLHRHLGNLLESAEGTDVTFQVAGETFKAHRYILGFRSDVFRAELLGPMKEGTDRESIIHVDDMEAEVFRALLVFVYTDRLPDDLGCMDDDEEELAMAQHLLVAADRYNLERLRLMCEDKLCELSVIDTGSVVTILVFAEQHNCPRIKEACFQFLRVPLNLIDVVATEDFDHLTRSYYPNVWEEILGNTAAAEDSDRLTQSYTPNVCKEIPCKGNTAARLSVDNETQDKNGTATAPKF